MRSFLVTIGTLTAVIGFIVQFVGLRALHWSATVYQLGVMLIMTIIRSFVRRGLIAETSCYALPDGNELTWLALYIDKSDADRRTNGALQSNLRADSSKEDDCQDRSTTITLTERMSQASKISEINTATCMRWLYSRVPSMEKGSLNPIHSEDDMSRLILHVITRWEPLTAHTAAAGFLNTTTFENHVNQISTNDEHIRNAFPPWPSHEAISQCKDVASDKVEVLLLFRELQRLISPPDAVIEWASTLASTIERTTDFLRSSNHVLWHEGQRIGPSFPDLDFKVRIVHGPFMNPQSNKVQNLCIKLSGKPGAKPAKEGSTILQGLEMRDRYGIAGFRASFMAIRARNPFERP